MTTRPEAVMRQRNTNSARLSFPSAPMPHSILFIFKKYDFQDVKANGAASLKNQSLASYDQGTSKNENSNGVKEKSQESIELPFPKSLTDVTSIRSTAFEMSAVTEKIAGSLNSAGNSNVGEALKQLKDAATGHLDTVKALGKDMANGGVETEAALKAGVNNLLGSAKDLDAGRLATGGAFLLRNIIGGDIAKTVSAVTGNIVNPRESLSFDGIDLKEHTFEWELFPSNQQDSENIRKIVNMLKYNASPGTDDERLFLDFPAVVDTFLIGVDPSHYPRFKTAMITNVTADYSGGNTLAIMKGGKPASVLLTMQISELAIHTKNDIDHSPLEQVVSEEDTADTTGAGE